MFSEKGSYAGPIFLIRSDPDFPSIISDSSQKKKIEMQRSRARSRSPGLAGGNRSGQTANEQCFFVKSVDINYACFALSSHFLLWKISSAAPP